MILNKKIIYLNSSEFLFNKTALKKFKKGDKINIRYLGLDTTKKKTKIGRFDTVTGLLINKYYNPKTNVYRIKLSALYKKERVIGTV